MLSSFRKISSYYCRTVRWSMRALPTRTKNIHSAPQAAAVAVISNTATYHWPILPQGQSHDCPLFETVIF